MSIAKASCSTSAVSRLASLYPLPETLRQAACDLSKSCCRCLVEELFLWRTEICIVSQFQPVMTLPGSTSISQDHSGDHTDTSVPVGCLLRQLVYLRAALVCIGRYGLGWVRALSQGLSGAPCWGSGPFVGLPLTRTLGVLP